MWHPSSLKTMTPQLGSSVHSLGSPNSLTQSELAKLAELTQITRLTLAHCTPCTHLLLGHLPSKCTLRLLSLLNSLMWPDHPPSKSALLLTLVRALILIFLKLLIHCTDTHYFTFLSLTMTFWRSVLQHTPTLSVKVLMSSLLWQTMNAVSPCAPRTARLMKKIVFEEKMMLTIVSLFYN